MKPFSRSEITLTTVQGEDEPPPRQATQVAKNVLIKRSAINPWQELLRGSVHSASMIATMFKADKNEVKAVTDRYPARINPYYLSLIKEVGDPIYKQCIPDNRELSDSTGEEDPLHEETDSRKSGVPKLITHRYPDRALFIVSNQCAMYCRFCTRKRKVGDCRRQPLWSEIREGIEYIRAHKEIRDVIISGGDPLMLGDLLLERILSKVHKIIKERPYGIMRIGTRIPCVLPQRITPELVNMLRKYHPLYVNTHFNHPREVTEESRRACGLLVDAGIPVGNQSVLLKGVNDDPVVMKELVQALVSMRVRPYYIYQADPVMGTNHLRTRVEKGLEIYKALRGHTSGLCVPTFVIDAPGGGGKIPLLPEYVKSITDEKVVMKNFEGNEYEYIQAE